MPPSKISFEVPGPIVGAVRTTQRGKFKSPLYRKYHAFKLKVRTLASIAGVPRELDADGVYAVRILVRFKGRARIDLDNIVKATLDACWGNDRRVLRIQAKAEEKQTEEGMRVWFRKI